VHQNTPVQIMDTPNSHGMFMLGTSTLYLCHMPMFGKEDHRYQVTLQAHLDPTSWSTFLADKQQHLDQAYNLINEDSDLFILPDVANGTVTSFVADVFRGYSNSGGGTPGPQIITAATVTIDRVVRFRALDQDIPRPSHLTYVLFGDGNQAHLDHYIADDPDFQHLLTLASVPNWLSVSQLRAGVDVAFIGMNSTPIGCSSPLTADTYQVMFEGLASTNVTLNLGTDASVWYSTGNMLNSHDPCDTSAPTGRQKSRAPMHMS
jgi:hypothetical protein